MADPMRGLDDAIDPGVTGHLTPIFITASDKADRQSCEGLVRAAFSEDGCNVATMAYLGIRSNGNRGRCHVWAAFKT